MSTQPTGSRLVTLTTDFGARDPYVAAMKAVLHSGCPGLTIEDLSHEIAPQDVLEGALFVAAAAPYFAPGTIHAVVIDPGVGADRHPIVASAGGQIFVCPDNGLLTLFLQEHPLEQARIITNPNFMRKEISPTFHARDVFAPAAARLAAGAKIEEAGEVLDTVITLRIDSPKIDQDGAIRGEVIHIDRFGNCITSIRRDLLRQNVEYRIHWGETTLPGIRRTYATVAPGEPLALFGGFGRLEIAVRDGNAHKTLLIPKGTPVTLSPL